jgi:bacterioferritin
MARPAFPARSGPAAGRIPASSTDQQSSPSNSLQRNSKMATKRASATASSTQPTQVTREQLIQGLQDDIAREYKAIIQYVIFSQKLDSARFMNIADQLTEHAHQELDHALAIARQLDYFGAYPVHEPKPIEVSKDNEGMLRLDLQAEDDTIRNYRERIRQADALGEYALGEILREIVKQEQDHQIDLATALGVVPNEQARKSTSKAKRGGK